MAELIKRISDSGSAGYQEITAGYKNGASEKIAVSARFIQKRCEPFIMLTIKDNIVTPVIMDKGTGISESIVMNNSGCSLRGYWHKQVNGKTTIERKNGTGEKQRFLFNLN